MLMTESEIHGTFISLYFNSFKYKVTSHLRKLLLPGLIPLALKSKSTIVLSLNGESFN